MPDKTIKPGQRIRVRHTIRRREGHWRGEVEGVVESVELKKTGSWYAHSEDNKYWLRRITLRKDDGELTMISLDQLSDVEVLSEPAGA